MVHASAVCKFSSHPVGGKYSLWQTISEYSCHKITIIIVHNSQQLQTRDGRIVGHVPLALARTFLYTAWFTCRITDVRRRSEGKGLVVPCVYIFRGKTNHLERLIAIFTSTSYIGR